MVPIRYGTFKFSASSFISFLYYIADVASEHAEGGMYIAPEFLLGQVYDGANQETAVVIYRPVYVAVRKTQRDDVRMERVIRPDKN